MEEKVTVAKIEKVSEEFCDSLCNGKQYILDPDSGILYPVGENGLPPYFPEGKIGLIINKERAFTRKIKIAGQVTL